MGWADWIADLLWACAERAAAYSRTLSPRELLEEQARWGRPHMGLDASHTRCVVCGLDPAPAGELCPGQPAAQRARRKLEARYGIVVR